MSAFKVTFAASTAPGAQWLDVFSLDVGCKVEGVTEVDTEAGYVLRHIRDGDGKRIRGCDHHLAVERINGAFEVRPRPDAPADLIVLLRQAVKANLGIRMTEGS